MSSKFYFRFLVQNLIKIHSSRPRGLIAGVLLRNSCKDDKFAGLPALGYSFSVGSPSLKCFIAHTKISIFATFIWLIHCRSLICVPVCILLQLLSRQTRNKSNTWKILNTNRYVRGYRQNFPDWVDNEIYVYLWYYSSLSPSKGYGGKTH
jgi:hypothetical protein